MIKTEIECNGLLAELGKEVIDSYVTGESGADIEDIVDALLALQRRITKITKGTIGVSGTIALSLDAESILSGLLRGQQGIGGFLSVDNDWKLQWPTDIGEDKGQQIRYRKNLVGIERDIKYDEYCTKLHPIGQEDLSSQVIGPVTGTITTDASYAYFTLDEQYAAYYGWLAEGQALPATVIVWKELSSPSWADGSSPTGSGWTDIAYCCDNNTGTYAYDDPIPPGNSTSWLTIQFTPGTYDKLRTWTWSNCNRHEIEVYDTDVGDWVNVLDGYLGPVNQWNEWSIGGNRNISAVRLKGFNEQGSQDDGLYVNEIQLRESSLQDDTANWVQGAWENIVRCDIGDYDGGSTYHIEYTHANYLMAWDKISDADDIVARAVNNKYEAYSLSLLEAGRLLLTELKEVPISYRVNLLDLSQNQDLDFSFDELQLGSIVTVIDEDLGISVSVRVIKITHPDLLSPHLIEVELSTRVRDISEYLADLRKNI